MDLGYQIYRRVRIFQMRLRRAQMRFESLRLIYRMRYSLEMSQPYSTGFGDVRITTDDATLEKHRKRLRERKMSGAEVVNMPENELFDLIKVTSHDEAAEIKSLIGLMPADLISDRNARALDEKVGGIRRA